MKKVCIQGLGFVGAAMAVAVANARQNDTTLIYEVIGVDRPTEQGRQRVEALNRGIFPFPNADTALHDGLLKAHSVGNLSATTDESAYDSADVIIIDVALDIQFQEPSPNFDMSLLQRAVRTVAQRIPEDSLILVETTVPPGTCEKVLVPVLEEELERRGLTKQAVQLAHSFERVMPGTNYLNSITGIWRAYAGYTLEAADACEEFLSTIIDVKNFPLTRLSSMTASETAKVMENTYRAINIAFIDEWTKYAEVVGIDLYEVIDAIRVRSTHSNIRVPGLGVGGYCLTKDPAFAPAAARQLFGIDKLDFPFSQLAMHVNQKMPTHAFDRLNEMLGGSCTGKTVLVLGVSYRQDISDTRYSPVEILVRSLEENGANVMGYDPYIDYWQEMDRSLLQDLPNPNNFDAIAITTAHQEFYNLELLDWLNGARPVVLDTVNVISKKNRQRYRKAGIILESIGRGVGL